MSFDLFQNVNGHRKRASAIGAAHEWRCSGSNGCDKRFNLGEQRLAFFDSQTFGDDFGQGAGGLRRSQFAHRHLLFGVIERVVFVRLKDAEFAQSLAGDAAGGDVGDAAVGEFEAGVGQIDLRRQYRNSDGVEFNDLAFDQAGDDVQFVNHQIHDHVDVEGAWSEDAHPMRLEESGALDARGHGRERGIEPFNVSHLKDQLSRFGRGDHPVGLVQRPRNRLFDQNVDARLQKCAGDFVMVGGRSSDADRFDLVEQFAVVADEARRVAFGDGASTTFVYVTDGDEFDLIE